MDLRLSEEQQMLGQTIRALCDRLSTTADVRALEGDPRGYREDLWEELARMDVLGLLVPEEHGGSGWRPVEVAVVSEELGRALVPSPFVETAVFWASLLQQEGVRTSLLELLPQITDGDFVTLAWHEPERTDTEEGVALRAEPSERPEPWGDDYRLFGEKILVPFAPYTAAHIVLARTSEGVTLCLADTEVGQASSDPEGNLASQNVYRVRYADTPATLIGRPGEGWQLFSRAATPALVAVAAYAIGGATKAHEMSVEYANERIQFDKPIGSYQAMAHPLADLRTEIDGARTLVHQAAWALAERRETAPALAAMAKYYACDVFRRTAKFGHQVFGGIGFTLDIDIQLFMRRAKQLEVTWFGPHYLEEIIAGAELDATPPLITADPVASGASR